MGVLGLDVGAKRIGVAVADPSATYALPLETIERSNLEADLKRILELADRHGADELVIGDPVTLSGQRGLAAEKMDLFVERVRRAFPGTVHRVDERLTTAQATKTLIAADVSRKKRRGAVDQVAAALILESFLQRRRKQRAT